MRCGSCGRTVTRNKAIHATCETRAAEKRYTPGQRFSWHADAPFARENGELSLLTFMIYLNDGYEGGATRFESSLVIADELEKEITIRLDRDDDRQRLLAK